MATPIVALPPGAILWHVGPHKTGTTAIQGLLGVAREQMLEAGVLYPGALPHHHEEARVLIGSAAGWEGDKDALPPSERWSDLVSAVRAHPGRSVVSSEFFGLADNAQRARIVEEIGAERLHVLIAARNPGSIALSTWQQVLRDGKTGALDPWLESAFRRPEPGAAAAKGFWSWADAAAQVEAWSTVLPIEQIRVIAIDETDRRLLPTAFEQLLELPAGLLADATPPHSNRGLTAPESELLRATIELTRAQLTWQQFSLFFRSGYALRLVNSRTPAPGEPKLALPVWAQDQAAAEADTSIARIEGSGVGVIGDLDALRRVPSHASTGPIETVPVELAAEAIAGVLTAAQRRIEKLEKQNARLRSRRGVRATDDAELSGRELARRLAGKARSRVTRRGDAPR
ncbi:hypothetical protein ACFQ0K_06360 [Nocardioides caeni]|uniref:Sulfotransferase family protein n=1 Tax=Nocardioides caeni TaxID=574700 RepID=A0A4S8N9B0_9ACTN|nr:hypothetical protein [Nocardioides caeni]THV12940.1 hypothetical protein E9934_11220 [Nocardioides caeni]